MHININIKNMNMIININIIHHIYNNFMLAESDCTEVLVVFRVDKPVYVA